MKCRHDFELSAFENVEIPFLIFESGSEYESAAYSTQLQHTAICFNTYGMLYKKDAEVLLPMRSAALSAVTFALLTVIITGFLSSSTNTA